MFSCFQISFVTRCFQISFVTKNTRYGVRLFHTLSSIISNSTFRGKFIFPGKDVLLMTKNFERARLQFVVVNLKDATKRNCG